MGQGLVKVNHSAASQLQIFGFSGHFRCNARHSPDDGSLVSMGNQTSNLVFTLNYMLTDVKNADVPMLISRQKIIDLNVPCKMFT